MKNNIVIKTTHADFECITKGTKVLVEKNVAPKDGELGYFMLVRYSFISRTPCKYGQCVGRIVGILLRRSIYFS